MQFWKVYTRPRELSRAGILGMNRRNHSYIGRYNPRRLYPLVDDKLKTKQLALAAGVSVPELIGTIREQHEVSQISEMVKDQQGFCIKPARGSGGKGIVLIARHHNGFYYKPNNKPETLDNLERHVSNILAGLYSLGGKPDTVLIQFGINDAAVDVWKNPPADRPRVSLKQYRENLIYFVDGFIIGRFTPV